MKIIMKIWLVLCTSILMQGKSQRYNVTVFSHWTSTQEKEAEREKVAKQVSEIILQTHVFWTISAEISNKICHY